MRKVLLTVFLLSLFASPAFAQSAPMSPANLDTGAQPAAMSTPATMEAPAVPAMGPVQPAMSVATPPAMKDGASAGKKEDSKGSVIGGILLQLLLGILTIALPIILIPLRQWVTKKLKVEDAQAQELIDKTVDRAVLFGLNYANEKAHQLRDNPVKGAEKLNIAAQKALEYLKDSGIVDKGAHYLKDLIEAKLGESRESNGTKAAPASKETKPVENPVEK